MTDCPACTRARKHPLSVERARAVLSYDAASGDLRWAISLSNRAKAGEIAGSMRKDGQRIVAIDGCGYRAHRLIWLLMTGAWPTNQIDHIDCDRRNNRWENLRDVPDAINKQNLRRPKANNRSGFLGVKTTPDGTFQARIRTGKSHQHLGTFSSAEAAHAAYVAAKRRLHEGCTL